MTQDNVWMLVRSLLIAFGSSLITQGYLNDAQFQALLGAAFVLFTLGWQQYVKWNTKSVPVVVVKESVENPSVPTIPTVSPVTGAVQKDGLS